LSTKKGRKIGYYGSNLTNTEAEVYAYIKDQFLTPKQITNRRKTSRQATYKTLNSLKKKGYITNDYKSVNQNQCTCQPKGKIRIHGIEINIRILHKDNRYHKQKNKSNLIFIDGNTIRLYNNSVEIYINKPFKADSVNKAYFDTLNYLSRFIIRLQNDLKVILLKNRYRNIKIVKVHVSDTNNELAKEYNINGDKFECYASEDGKLWGLIDNSFNLNEMETVHPETHKRDMEKKIVPFFNDLRDNTLPLFSEVWQTVSHNTQMHGMWASNVKRHMEVLESMDKTLKKINERLNW